MTWLIALFAISNVSRADEPAFETAAAPVFRKYCISCHNDQEREGGLSLVTPARIAAGGEHGSALLPGDAKSSRMIRMMLGKLEPTMPPEGSKGPTPAELEALMRWIDDGAKTEGGTDLTPSKLVVPNLKSRVSRNPITDLRWSPDGKIIAVARYQTVEILDGKTKKPLFQLADHPGKVNSIRFSPDSGFLLTASGIAGLKGVALEWDLKTRSVRRRYANHSDVMYAAVYSPDGRQLATAGYDRKVLIWSRGQDDGDVSRPRWTLVGHNDAVYDLQFSSRGNVLASASGDQTVKLWDAVRGRRLDTLGQPLKEQFVTLFHPRRDFLLGAGRDNRIRQWKLETGNSATMNPLLISRFAHEASIVGLAYSKDGSLLVSSAEDKTIKLWSGDDVELISTLPGQSDVAFGISISPDGELAVGRMDGTIGYYHLPLIDRSGPKKGERMAAEIRPNVAFETRAAIVEESEPNSSPGNAQKIELPVTLKGTLFQKGSQLDADLFEFRARKGETWVFETNAARSKSPADTRIDILTPSGETVTRVRLQAVRDSYFTFRGKDANTSDDFRVHNWQEMELNELLYCNGEIVKLFLYPRGPDSGFKVYPGFGTRHNFFDTTPVAHALQEPCYIVKAFPPGTAVTPNGLRVFDIPYENDDDAERKLGTDSKLFFTAPVDGTFLVKVSDSRGFQGEK
ncbi:MAG: c-type cytochrome domain-containing protein, partial [Planctomycetota bacterium]|nr:c-type cytochrome domain-containing protein [Planctomycetota bacterium]